MKIIIDTNIVFSTILIPTVKSVKFYLTQKSIFNFIHAII